MTKARFEPPTPPTNEEEDLRSRTDARRERKQVEEALMTLATQLVEIPARTLEKLALPETLLDIVHRARAVVDGGPKNRALRLVRMALRDGDAQTIEYALRDVHEPRRTKNPPEPSRETELERWRSRLLTGGEAALTELVTAFPGTDRRQLRQLVRNARKASAGTPGTDALTKLLRRTLA